MTEPGPVEQRGDGRGEAPAQVRQQPIVVQKYGGSSVADVARIRAVAQRVAATVAAGKRVVVVVSAMGNTTNELLALARAVSPNPGRRELDLLVSVGERVSMTLLAMAIQDLGLPAASFTGSQSGIITDDRHVAARVLEVRPYRLREALDAGKVVIVAGFQGVSRGREVTTLGRGGSDTTAVVLAAALGAEHCELCSDVDGVYSADPRVVPAARRVEELPLDAMLSLAQLGSKVLNADAVAMAREMGVVLKASATADAPGSGTSLPPGPAPETPVAVAVDTELELVAAGPHELSGCEGAVRAWWAHGDGPRALVDLRNLPDRLALGFRSLGPVAAVSAVGRQLVTDPSCTARALQAIAPLEPLHWWASGATWTALIPRDKADDAQRALHRALIEDGGVLP